MNIDYITLLIIGSISSIVIFLCLVIGQQIYKNHFFKKIEKKSSVRFAIKFLEIIFIIGVCLFLVLIPEIGFLNINKTPLISLFYLLIILLASVFFDIWLSFLSAFPFLICFIIYLSATKIDPHDFLLTTIYQIIFLFLALAFSAFNEISKKKFNNFYQIVGSIALAVVYIIITVIFFHSNKTILNQLLIQVAIIWLIYVVSFIVYNWYYLLNNKIQSISSSQKYENTYFLNNVIANQTIYEYIKNNNLQYGLVVLFNLINFNQPNSNYDNSANKYIKQQFLKEIIDHLKPLKPVFFMTEDNQYACFIALKDVQSNLSTIYNGNNRTIRIEKDFIHQIQNHFYHIPKTVIYQNKKQQISSCAYSAIYGIHSSNLNELVKLCIRTKQDSYLKFRNSTLVVFDPKNVKSKKWNSKNYDYYHENFSLNQFHVQLNINNDVLDQPCYIAKINYLPKLLFSFSEIKQYALQKNILEHTIRSVAMLIIKEYSLLKTKNIPIVLDYSLSYLVSDYFNLEELINKLAKFNIEYQSLILKLDLDDIKNNANFTNIKILQEYGIKIVLTNATVQNLDFFKQIQPDYLAFKHPINSQINKLAISKMLSKFNSKLVNN